MISRVVNYLALLYQHPFEQWDYGITKTIEIFILNHKYTIYCTLIYFFFLIDLFWISRFTFALYLTLFIIIPLKACLCLFWVKSFILVVITAVKSNAIPNGQMPLGPKSLNQNRLLKIIQTSKNSHVVDKQIYHVNDYDGNNILGKKFLAEYYSIPETIFNVSKSHLFATTRFAALMRYSHGELLTQRYISFFTSTFRLNTYINRVQGIMTSDIHKAVSTFGTKIELGQYQIDDILEFINESILISVLFRFFDKDIKVPMLFNSIKNLIQLEKEYTLKDLILDKVKLQAFGILSPLQAERRIFLNYVKSILEEHKKRPVKSSVRISKFVLDNKEIFETNSLDRFAKALVQTVVLAQDTLLHKIYDSLFWIVNNPHAAKRLYDEQMLVIQSYGPEITHGTLNKMHILDSVIRETVRLTHPTIFASRYINKTMTFSNGVTLKKGSLASLNGSSVHRHMTSPEINSALLDYKNDSRDNFNDVTPDNISWSVGPRMCLAKDFASGFMKEYFAILLREYYIEPLYTNTSSRKKLFHGLNYHKSGAILIKRK